MPSFYHFTDKRFFDQKSVFSLFLPIPVSFEALTREFPWNPGYKGWYKNVESLHYPMVSK